MRRKILPTHPSNPQQATALTSPALTSLPSGAAGVQTTGQQQGNAVDPSDPAANGIGPLTPANLPDAAGQGLSGIIPTLQ